MKNYRIIIRNVSTFGNRPARESHQSGTLAELIKAFSYTLETGRSYEREKGNKKINLQPKTISGLVANLNNAKTNAAANGYSGTTYSYSEV